ncbi:MAG TPA: hypothetical protein PKE64_31230 [Anaerolineae bacterium]|nr:hypothetical protein [Anaerolineae bacterium]
MNSPSDPFEIDLAAEPYEDLCLLHSVVTHFQKIARASILASDNSQSYVLPEWFSQNLRSAIQDAELLQQKLDKILGQFHLHQLHSEDE